MNLDWREIDRWAMGEAWTGSRIREHLKVLCDDIGPRWSSSEAERQAVEYIRDQVQADGADSAALEAFQLETWAWSRAEAGVVEDGRGIDAAHLWRWRFHGRHADAEFHHEPGDTVDKVNVRELKEYVGQLARLLLRLSHISRLTFHVSHVLQETT